MSRASASGSGTWFDHLPFVLLGMRTSIREDSGCCPADLLCGAPLRLPGDCFEPSQPVPMASAFAHHLRSVISAARPMPVLHHGLQTSRIDPALRSSSHVFLRVDAVKPPLSRPYDGPFRVVARSAKTFRILRDGKSILVSVDRLKPAFALSPASSPPSTPLDVPVDGATDVFTPLVPLPPPPSPRSADASDPGVLGDSLDDDGERSGSDVEDVVDADDDADPEDLRPVSPGATRTRSGRVSRPPARYPAN